MTNITTVATEVSTIDFHNGELTPEQHLDIGNQLAAIMGRTRWNIGDWYRYRPIVGNRYADEAETLREDYHAVLEKMEISKQTASQYASTATAFPEPKDRAFKLTFTHYMRVAQRKELNAEQKRRLLLQAVENQWNSRTLEAKARKAAELPPPPSPVGRPKTGEATKNVVKETIAAAVDMAVNKIDPDMPKAARRKIERVVNISHKGLEQEFPKAVAAETARETATLSDNWTEFYEESKKLKDGWAALDKKESGLKSFMTRDEFRKLRGWVSPDKVSQWDERKATEATTLLNRIGTDAGWV